MVVVDSPGSVGLRLKTHDPTKPERLLRELLLATASCQKPQENRKYSKPGSFIGFYHFLGIRIYVFVVLLVAHCDVSHAFLYCLYVSCFLDPLFLSFFPYPNPPRDYNALAKDMDWAKILGPVMDLGSKAFRSRVSWVGVVGGIAMFAYFKKMFSFLCLLYFSFVPGHPKVPCFLEVFCYLKLKSIPLGVLICFIFLLFCLFQKSRLF